MLAGGQGAYAGNIIDTGEPLAEGTWSTQDAGAANYNNGRYSEAVQEQDLN
jgi:hypothetical protein